VNEFFVELGARWVAAAKRRGVDIEAPALDARVALELLELARTAAHTRERRFAPLSSYLAGIAAERVRQARPDFDDGAAAAFIREVWKELEAEAGPAGDPATGR
jgi:uncharacterized protein DUF6457